MLRSAPPHVPRLLFTHAGDTMRGPDEIALEHKDYAHAKVVLIARHPGDIAVSRYHHLKHRSRDRSRKRLAEQPLETFVWDRHGGIPSIVAFLNQVAALPGVTIIRYEDFLSAPERTLGRLARAIGLETGDEDIVDAARFGSLANLKEREREGYFRSSRLRQAKRGDERSAKVRSGTSGGYRSQLGKRAAARVDAYVREHLDPSLGYSRSGLS
jgi:hypothetical protein